jgi:hypothetical protein
MIVLQANAGTAAEILIPPRHPCALFASLVIGLQGGEWLC